ncbi:hypothetical protein ACLK19_17800 [Escherichia coli]
MSDANQLGARQGGGAVYLHAHHPDILRFLIRNGKNADEKIRIKTLSLAAAIPTSLSIWQKRMRRWRCFRLMT